MKKLLLFSFALISGLAYSQTTVTLSPSKDARLSMKPVDPVVANTNYGTYEGLHAYAWTTSGDSVFYRGLLAFDLSTLPFGAVVTDAKLSLYHDPNSLQGQHSPLSGDNSCYLRRVTSNWSESTVTWNTQPTSTMVNEITFGPSVTGTEDFLDLPVTQLVQDMLDNPSSSDGFLLGLVTEITYRKMIFASSDHADTNLHPELEITYLDVTSLDELNSQSAAKELIKITDLMGRETEDKPNALLIYTYSDGSKEKVIRVQ